MIFDLYCASANRDEGQITQLGGCGIILVVADELDRVQRREFSYGLGGSAGDLCEIQAARLALASIAPAFRAHKVTLHTQNSLVATLLSGSDDFQLYKYVITELRRWYSYYKDINVVLHAGPDLYFDKAVELAILGLEKQAAYDSGTLQTAMLAEM